MVAREPDDDGEVKVRSAEGTEYFERVCTLTEAPDASDYNKAVAFEHGDLFRYVRHTLTSVWPLFVRGSGGEVGRGSPRAMYRVVCLRHAGARPARRRAARDDGGRSAAIHTYPFNTVCSPLSYSGNPGVNGVSDGGVHSTLRSAEKSATRP